MRELTPALLPGESPGDDIVDLSLGLDNSEVESWIPVLVGQLVLLLKSNCLLSFSGELHQPTGSLYNLFSALPLLRNVSFLQSLVLLYCLFDQELFPFFFVQGLHFLVERRPFFGVALLQVV